jgi:hypothetical protein
MEAACSSETEEQTHYTIRCKISEYHHLNSTRRENLKTYKLKSQQTLHSWLLKNCYIGCYSIKENTSKVRLFKSRWGNLSFFQCCNKAVDNSVGLLKPCSVTFNSLKSAHNLWMTLENRVKALSHNYGQYCSFFPQTILFPSDTLQLCQANNHAQVN